jgi:DNA-directed RNA polymerase specialized sigma24 family protein
MCLDLSFDDLMGRVRARDNGAAAEFVHRYGPAVRRALHARLSLSGLRRLRRQLDAMDVCQSVLASFFRGTAEGRYRLDGPAQVLALLRAMARNQLLYQVSRWRTRGRGGHLAQRALFEGQLIDPGPGPSQQAAQRELLQEFHRRLSCQEQWLKQQRFLGRSWAEVAADVGDCPEAVRMRYRRKMHQVARELRLDE